MHPAGPGLHSARHLYRDRVARKRRDPPAMTVQDVLDDIRKRPGTGEVIPIIDPATEEQITEFTDCGHEAINDAVARAKETAQSGVWSGMPDYDRAKVLWRVADLIDENAKNTSQPRAFKPGRAPALWE